MLLKQSFSFFNVINLLKLQSTQVKETDIHNKSIFEISRSETSHKIAKARPKIIFQNIYNAINLKAGSTV